MTTQPGTIDITQQNLDSILNENEIVILDFWASWCGPCRMFAPIFEKAAQGHPEIKFGKVNTEEQQELAREFHIMSIPTLAVFRQNIMLLSQPGMLPEAALEDLIKQVKALDMEKIKKEIEERETNSPED